MQVATGKIMHRIYTALESHAAQTPENVNTCNTAHPPTHTVSHKHSRTGCTCWIARKNEAKMERHEKYKSRKQRRSGEQIS